MAREDPPKVHANPAIFRADDPGAGAEALAIALRRGTSSPGSGLRFWLVVIVLSLALLTLLVVQRHDAYKTLRAEELRRKQQHPVAALASTVTSKDLNVVRTDPPRPGQGGVGSGAGAPRPNEAPAGSTASAAPNAKGSTARPFAGSLAPLGLCVVVRTREDHHERLSHLVESLLLSARQTSTLYMRILLLDVQQRSPEFSGNMEQYAQELNARSRTADPGGNSTVSVLRPPRVAPTADKAHGYEYTYWARDYLKGREDCSHVLFASGASYYVSTVTLVLEPLLRRGIDMVAFDYVSHDRDAWEAAGGTNVVTVKMRPGYVTLGAVVMERTLATETADVFSGQAMQGKAPSVRDYHFVKRLSRIVPPDRIVMLHQTLLIDQ